MAQYLLANNLPDGTAPVTLNGSLASGATSVSVVISASAQLPTIGTNQQLLVRIEQELILVPSGNTTTAGTTQTWTGLTRAQEGTSQPASHATSTPVYMVASALVLPSAVSKLTASGVTFTLDSAGHVLWSGGGTPSATSIVSGADANTSISVTGNDVCGKVVFTTGATTIAGLQIRLTFAAAWSTAPLSARGDISGGTALVAGGAVQVLNLSTTIAEFALVAKPSTNTVYTIYYSFN